jgi:hypothetical protein
MTVRGSRIGKSVRCRRRQGKRERVEGGTVELSRAEFAGPARARDYQFEVEQVRELAEKAGWGRIHVSVMPTEHAQYLAKYLSRDRPPCLKRWRLCAAFGEGWKPNRVKDLTRESLFSTIYRACKE